jgi:death-on-curing protein
MQRPPRFLTIDEILTLHETALHQYGGLDGIRDRGALESAIAMPQQGFSGEYAHAFPFEMAAAYGFHIAQNQSFLDGNKRTALSATVAFLRMNGWSLIADETEASQQILDFATKQQDKGGFAKWLEANSKARPSMELREFFTRLTYKQIAEMLNSGLIDSDAQRAHESRITTMMEAATAIPAIHEANLGAQSAKERGEEQSAVILLGQSHLLTALYRIAEDMGYEW